MNSTRCLQATAAAMVAGLLTSCAVLDTEKSESPTAEQAYIQYYELVEQGDGLRRLAEQWDEPARVMMLETPDGEGGTLPLERFAGALRYPQLFKVPPTGPRYAVINDDQNCVVLEGHSTDDDPLVVQVLLTQTDAEWKHSELFVISSGDGEPMMEHALCQPFR